MSPIHTAQRSKSRKTGSAIIIVLLLIFLLTVSVVSFFLLVQDDRQRAHSFLDVIRAQIMIESASQEVLAKIMDGSEVPYTTSGVPSGEQYRAQAGMTASPGLMEVRYFDQPPNRGYETGAAAFTGTNAFFPNPFNNQYQLSAGVKAPANPWLIPLFSWKWYAPGIRYLRISGGTADTSATNANYNPAVQFNINTIENPFYPGELYLSGLPLPTVAAKAAYDGSGRVPNSLTFNEFQFATGESSLDRPIYVQWIPIYEDPSKPPGPKNKVVGRYAYWVDVENTKVNLNTSRRLFEESTVRAVEGKSQYDLNTDNKQYDVLAPTLALSSKDPAVPNPNSGTADRDAIEAKVWKSNSGPNEIEKDLSTNQGNNNAASAYFNLWFGWNPSATNSEHMLPYAADSSMVDWRVFTGMRPYGNAGQGTNISVEQLTSSYGTNLPGAGAFNTWLESYSMLDPQVQVANATNGQLTLATMRRTHSMSTTIYGYEDELDPLGRPKIDIVSFQNQSSAGGNAVYNEIWNRLGDPNYHGAYYPNAFTDNGIKKSFMQSFNGFAGDLNPANNANGQAVVNQMLVNIYSYGRPHTEPPQQEMGGLNGNTTGVWPVKSMPYVAEVATRARSAMFLLSGSDRNNLSNFFVSSGSGSTATWSSVSPMLTGTDGAARPSFWYLTNVMVDMAFGFVNPNPFATNTNITTLTIQAQNGTFWNGVTQDPSYTNNVVLGPSASDSIQGVFALRPAPAGILGGGSLGLRANGTNCYFNMGVVPGSTITNNGTALEVKGWQITDAGGNIFDQVPMPHLAQQSGVRSWWQMALTGNNAGPIYHMTSLAWFRSGGISTKTVSGKTLTYPDFSSLTNRAVGWFTSKTLCEFTNVSANPVFPWFIFPSDATAYGPYGTSVATMANIPDSVFQSTWKQYLMSHMTNSTNYALVERVQCVDPVLGHRTGNPDNSITAASANSFTALDVAGATQRQVQAAAAGNTLSGHFYGVAGHPWRLYDNYATNIVTSSIGSFPIMTSKTNQVTVIVQVPVGNTFVPEPVTYNVVTQVPTGSSSGVGAVTNAITSLSCLTKPFDNPNVTRTNQAEWDGTYIPQYGGFQTGNQSGQNGEASVIWTTNNGVQWPADLENNTVTYAGPPGSVGGNGWYFDRRPGPAGGAGSPTGIRGIGSAGTVSPAATFVTPWGIVDSAPSGQPMVSIGELGFVHSGFPQHPINLSAVQYLHMANYGGASTNILGSPQNGPPMSMLLDLFTPHAFRDNVTQNPISTTQSGWVNSAVQNTPSNPRRGTLNVNVGVASDYYLAIREGAPSTAVRADPSGMAVRPAWVPTAMFFRNSNLPSKDESDLLNSDVNGGRLDSFVQPVPRYRRGWDSVISMIGGDFSPFREMGEGAWLGSGPSAPQTSSSSTDGGVGYTAIGMPLATWKPGLGATNTALPFAIFDPQYGAASKLLTLGREAAKPAGSSTRGYFTGHFAADGVSFDTTGANNMTTFLASNVNNDAKGNLWEATRFAITPLRHFLSEIPYDVTGQRDIYVQNNTRMSITPDVGNIHTAINMGPPSGGTGTANGSAGIMNQMGIYQNSFIEQAANMASTSANAFTIHVVAQAIKNTGQVRYSSPGVQDVGNSGPGYMNVDDQVLAEQWAQIVVERVPQTTSGGDLSRDSNGAPINDYKILYYRILDNAK